MYFECINIQQNNYKFYRIDVQPSLFGTLLLTRQWGRIGSRHPRQKEEEYLTLDEVTRRIRQILRRRFNHHYQLLNSRIHTYLPAEDGSRKILIQAEDGVVQVHLS